MDKSGSAKRMRNSTNLHRVSNPLCAAGKSAAAALILLVDQDIKTQTHGIVTPKLPSSFSGKIGEHIELPAAKGRLIVIGCGRPGQPASEPAFWEDAGAAIIDGLRALRIERATLGGTLQPTAIDASTAARCLAIGPTLASYRCMRYPPCLIPDTASAQLRSIS